MQLFNTEYNNGKNSLFCCFLNELNVRKLEESPIPQQMPDSKIAQEKILETGIGY